LKASDLPKVSDITNFKISFDVTAAKYVLSWDKVTDANIKSLWIKCVKYGEDKIINVYNVQPIKIDISSISVDTIWPEFTISNNEKAVFSIMARGDFVNYGGSE
jgi:hypothetical protein